MRRYVHEAVVDTPPDKLWRAIVDLRRWPEWDAGLEPRGGPAVRMSVEGMEPPSRFVDLAHLPLANMRGLQAQDAGAQTEASVRFAACLS